MAQYFNKRPPSSYLKNPMKFTPGQFLPYFTISKENFLVLEPLALVGLLQPQ